MRPLKRWRYVGAYGPDVMACIGDARIGPFRQRFWAVCEPGRPIVDRTTLGRGGFPWRARVLAWRRATCGST